MDAARFHNALRVLLNLTPRQLAEAGVIDANWGSAEASDRAQVIAFMDNPFREAIRMPDANFDRLHALIESRQPKRGVPDILSELKKAEAFIAGFEDDELQKGVSALLTGIRAAIKNAEAA